MIQFTYGLATLASLWAFGGGEFQQFWGRQLVLIFILWTLALACIFGLKQKALLKVDARQIKIGVGAGIVLALPVIALLFFKQSLWVGPLVPPGMGAVLLTGILWSAAAEIIARGFLQPAWGIATVAFLDAIAIGFGTQMFAPFIAFWAMGYLWGYLTKKYGLMTSVISRCVWTTLVLLSLRLL